MSIFVPLADDLEGTISAVSLGDYILSIMKKLKPDSASDYYEQLLNQFKQVDGQQVINDPLQLFKLLLSEHQMVLDHLQDARDNYQTTIILLTNENNSQVEKEMVVSALEANRGVEEYFTILIYMTQLLFKSPDLMKDAVIALLDVLTNSQQFSELRIKLMQLLYNSLMKYPEERVRVLLAILNYASKFKCFGLIVQYMRFIYEWIKNLDFDSERKVEAYHLIAQELESFGKFDESDLFWRLRAEECKTEALIKSPTTIAASLDLCVKSLKNHNILCYDFLLKYKCVAHLKETEHSKIYDLVYIMAKGNESDIRTFANSHPEIFNDYGISVSECVNKIQLLTLESIFGGVDSISMQELSNTLGTSLQETEELVVSAITRGVINALADQENQMLYIKSATKRDFNKPQWEQLYNGLQDFKARIARFNKLRPDNAVID